MMPRDPHDQTALAFHPIANVFPLISGQEFDELVADVREHGVREPAVLYEGAILDGRNRWRASLEANVDCPTVEYRGDDPVAFVVSLNLRRRHMDESQRSAVAAKITTLGHGGNRRADQAANLPLEVTQSDAAKMLNVSERSVRNAVVVRDHGIPEIMEKVVAGDLAVSTAATVARLPQEEQERIAQFSGRGLVDQLKAAVARAVDRETGGVRSGPERFEKPKPSPDYFPWLALSGAVELMAGKSNEDFSALARQAREGGLLTRDLDMATKAIERLPRWRAALQQEGKHGKA